MCMESTIKNLGLFSDKPKLVTAVNLYQLCSLEVWVEYLQAQLGPAMWGTGVGKAQHKALSPGGINLPRRHKPRSWWKNTNLFAHFRCCFTANKQELSHSKMQVIESGISNSQNILNESSFALTQEMSLWFDSMTEWAKASWSCLCISLQCIMCEGL